jgi:hypothetical protein
LSRAGQAAAALTLAALLGCAGMGESEPPPPAGPRPPPVPLVLPDRAAAAPEGAPQEARQVGEADLPEEIRVRLDNIGARLAGVQDAETFGSVWTDADVLAREVEGAIRGLGSHCGDLDFTLLVERFSWMGLTCVAEGSEPVVIFLAEPWEKAAVSSPEPADDVFLALMDQAYGSVRPGAWPEWIEQMSDVSGCSRLGEGVIVSLLQKTDQVGSLLPGPVTALRAELLRELSPSHAPYCKGDRPRPDAELAAEVQRVLQEVQLTEAERAAVEAHAQAGLKGEPFNGG